MNRIRNISLFLIFTTIITIAFLPRHVGQQISNQDPVSFVVNYWSNVSAGQYKIAWAQLSPTFQQNKHNGKYRDYLNGYQSMNICQIDTSNARIVAQGSSNAIVFTSVIYYTGSKCTKSIYYFDHYLVYDPNYSQWLLDGVKTRNSNTSDEQIAQAAGIQDVSQPSDRDVQEYTFTIQAAKNGDISKEEASSRLGTIAARVGKDGMRWIVNNTPVYDQNTGKWNTFGNYVHDLLSDSDVPADSRFAQDPVGTAIDLTFGTYDTSDIQDWLGIP